MCDKPISPYSAKMNYGTQSVNRSKVAVLPNFSTNLAQQVAMRSVIFDTNCYIIPKVITSIDFIPNLCLPFHLKVSLKSMKVCSQYNSKQGCLFVRCYRFHICRLWLCDTIHEKSCLLLHGILGAHNLTLLKNIHRPTLNVHDDRIICHLKRDARSRYNAELWKIIDKSELICLHNMDELCTHNQCKSLHIHSMFQWEINVDGNWKKFTLLQNQSLEKDYCNPKNATLEKQVKPSNPFCEVLGQGSCTIDYNKFTIYAINSTFKIRRQSTPSDIACNNSFATRWLWYWQDEGLTWHLYSSGVIDDVLIVPLSDHIESLFLAGIKELLLTITGFHYSLNFDSMTQLNLDLMVATAVRRRPLLTILDDWNDVAFRKLWSKTNVTVPVEEGQKEAKFVKNEVLFTSPEYVFVVKMLMQTLPTISDVKVVRIENQLLWNRYQQKKLQMIEKHKGNLNAVNEQYLFHDSGLANVDHVCTNNFDHSSLGAGLGLNFGKGLYFTNLASLSCAFATVNKANYKSMYVALVLVGEATVGDESMDQLPFIYPASNIRFDTTVNHNSLPGIFVKYNNDEFYPAYYIEYQN